MKLVYPFISHDVDHELRPNLAFRIARVPAVYFTAVLTKIGPATRKIKTITGILALKASAFRVRFTGAIMESMGNCRAVGALPGN